MNARVLTILSIVLICLHRPICNGDNANDNNFSPEVSASLGKAANSEDRLNLMAHILQHETFSEQDKIATILELYRTANITAINILIENITFKTQPNGIVRQPAQDALRKLGAASIGPIVNDIRRSFESERTSTKGTPKLVLERETLLSIMRMDYFKFLNDNKEKWNPDMITFMSRASFD